MTILDCGHAPTQGTSIGTGYGEDCAGKRYCYDCCAELTRHSMRENGKAMLYLIKRDDGWHVTDWPGKLDLPVPRVRRGNHNIARVRYDFDFTFENQPWVGVQYGDNTQIAHCRRVKG